MSEIEYREYRPEDAESFVRLHDSCFPALSPSFWQECSQGPVTAAVAVLDGEVVGTVPFQFRDLRVRPDAVVRIAWEFSVCVREELRGTGVGSRLMDTAKGFLPGRCAAMAVYRNDEQSPPYRFYARNGHEDLMYARPWVHRGAAARPLGVQEVETSSWEDFLAEEAEYLHVFTNAYGPFGGFPQRLAGYYESAVRTAQYDEIPLDLSVLALRNADRGLLGYVIAGEERDSPTYHLMEIAAVGNDLSIGLILLSSFCQKAADRGIKALASMTDSSPYVPLLRGLGFGPTRRSESSMVVMAHALDPEGVARAVWRESEASAGLDVVAWTPSREVTLHHARREPKTTVLLEMKESTLTRLLFSRLNLQAAVADERVSVVGAGEAEIQAIAGALPYTPWAYHYLDYG